ncbi:MAG TPA: DUF2207 domain-containing protein, partial [Gemmatimonadota bacterium]|nr:DUF2207 domain-containing protein [Gemmatimonadota bacterium]
MIGRWSFILCGAILLLAPGTVATEPAVQSRQLSIRMFDATYNVTAAGVIYIEERITFRFDGSWNGVYRWIPVKYRLDTGGTHQIYLDVESVTDDAGTSLRHQVTREGALVKIKTWVPGAQDATRTVVYRYKVENGLRFFDDDDGMDWAHDELYWNVTGDEWEMEIARVQAAVELPQEVTGLRATAFTGVRGATGRDVEQFVTRNTVSFETTRRLGYREGMTIVVGWDPGVVARPGAITRARWLLARYLFLPLPIIAFFAMFRLWRRKGRDPELSRSVMPQYETPQGMSPAEVGTLMDFTVDPRDLSATIIDLAVRGYLRIEEVPGGRRKRPKDHIIHILKDPAGVTDLKPHELETLRSLDTLAGEEDGHRSVKVSDLKQKFYKHIDKIKRLVYDRLTEP